MGFFDKLTSKAKELAGSENFDKLSEKAKQLGESAKSAIHAATAPSPPPQLTPRQKELAEKFGYTVKDDEKIIFASDTRDVLITSHTHLFVWPSGEECVITPKKDGAFRIYFPKGWWHIRVALIDSDDELRLFGNYVGLPEDEAQALCQAWIDHHEFDKAGLVAVDGLTLTRDSGDTQWQYETDEEFIQRQLEIYAKECDFELSPGEEVIYCANGSLLKYILTSKNFLIDMIYHGAYDRACPTVLGFENGPLKVQIEPGGTIVHILPADSGVADRMNMFFTEVIGLVAAIGHSWDGGPLVEYFGTLNTDETAVEIIVNPNGTVSCDDFEAANLGEDEYFFTHPNAEIFHQGNQPSLGMVFALLEEDGFYYPAEGGKPNQDGLVEVKFLHEHKAVVGSGQWLDFGNAIGTMKFQLVEESDENYYDCEITGSTDDYSEVTLIDKGGVKKQADILLLRAHSCETLPPVRTVFAFNKADEWYYPGVTGSGPAEHFKVDLMGVLAGSSMIVAKEHLLTLADDIDRMGFQANRENKGLFYSCQLYDASDNATELTAVYLDDGFQEPVDISRLRAELFEEE